MKFLHSKYYIVFHDHFLYLISDAEMDSNQGNEAVLHERDSSLNSIVGQLPLPSFLTENHNLSNEINYPEYPESFKCSMCDLEFPDDSSLEKHIEIGKAILLVQNFTTR